MLLLQLYLATHPLVGGRVLLDEVADPRSEDLGPLRVGDGLSNLAGTDGTPDGKARQGKARGRSSTVIIIVILIIMIVIARDLIGTGTGTGTGKGKGKERKGKGQAKTAYFTAAASTVSYRKVPQKIPEGAHDDLQESADEVGDPRQLGDLFVRREAFEVGGADGDALL